ncbi:MAG: histidine kinase [Thermoleophilia bacterium]|jgi:signal transduction histidine kinase|nr:histidine kinase [Thermoleophilia bacterium]
MPEARARVGSGDGAGGGGRPGGLAGIAGGGGRPGRLGSIVALVVWATVVVRVFATDPPAHLIPWYAGGLLVFAAVQIFVLWRPALPVALLYVAFGLQAAVVLVMLAFNPNVDFLTALLALEAYQAAVLFSGRTRYVWVGLLLGLIAVALVLGLGVLEGLALAFVPMAVGLVLAMFAVASRDLEAARAASERMVADLREAHASLEAYAGQVEELAAIEERARVAQELEASVSATLDEVLAATRAVREASGAADEPSAVPDAADAAPDLARAAPDEASAALERLQALTQEALAQMRRIIAELRPPVA